jgi:hypothetical protein
MRLAPAAGAEIATEERHHVVLKTAGAGMGSPADLQGVRDAVGIEDGVGFGGPRAQAILIADVDAIPR